MIDHLDLQMHNVQQRQYPPSARKSAQTSVMDSMESMESMESMGQCKPSKLGPEKNWICGLDPTAPHVPALR